MSPEYTLIFILGIVFFTAILFRFIWLAVKTKENAFWYTSIIPLMFILGLASILLGNPVVWVLLMFFIGPYSLVILLKFWRRIISTQTKLSLKGWTPQEPMKLSDFFTMKGWIKLAKKRGKNQTLFIYFLFSLSIILVLFIALNYAFPSVFDLTIVVSSIVIGLIIAMLYFKTALESQQYTS